MKKRTEQKCCCGAHTLTPARGKYRLKRWKRIVEWLRPGYAVEHRDDICWGVEYGEQPRRSATNWSEVTVPVIIHDVYGLQPVARKAA